MHDVATKATTPSSATSFLIDPPGSGAAVMVRPGFSPVCASRPSRGEPEADVGGLHGLPDDAREVGLERVDIDLLAQSGREGVYGACRVVTGPVEAVIDGAL